MGRIFSETTKDEILGDDAIYLGVCRGCGHDLEPGDMKEQEEGPEDEILLQCSVLDTQDCVVGEWFKVTDFV